MSVVLGAENKDVRANVAAQMLNKGFGMLGVSPETIAATAPVRTYSAPNDTSASAATFNAAYYTKDKKITKAGATKSIESSRSSTPPCPGISFP